MGDGQVFPQAAHGLHLVAVHGMNHRTGTEEEQRLEESVRKEVEHGGRIALARMTAHTRHAERDHHIGYLRMVEKANTRLMSVCVMAMTAAKAP